MADRLTREQRRARDAAEGRAQAEAEENGSRRSTAYERTMLRSAAWRDGYWQRRRQPGQPTTGVGLEIEWSNQPFLYGESGGVAWPFPLVRPYPYPPGADPEMHGRRVTVPADLMDRYRLAEQLYLAVQAELRQRAVDAGEIRPEDARDGGT